MLTQRFSSTRLPGGRKLFRSGSRAHGCYTDSKMVRRAMGTALLIVFGVICAGLIAEGGVRIANRYFPYFYCYDAARGWGLRPNTAGYYRREGGSYVEINSGGFRGPEVAKGKLPGTIRIAVLGASYTEAIQVAYEATFAS